MALEAKLLQKLSQSLLMTPQLQQAIKLLQLGRLEYKEAIERELLDNPILEEQRESEDSGEDRSSGAVATQDTPGPLVEGPAIADGSVGDSAESEVSTPSSTKGALEWEDYLESFSDWRGAATPRGTFDDEERSPQEPVTSRDLTLEEHIIEQLRFREVSPELHTVLFNIIGNLNKDGYLAISYEELADAVGCTVEVVEQAIDFCKTLDPSGIAARDLKECLLFQLANRGLDRGLEGRLVTQHLDKLERRRYDQIAKEENVDVETVIKALGTIQALDPRPGRQFADETARYVVPDVYVQKVGSDYVVTLNEDGLPKLRISPYYLSVLRGEGADNVPNKAYLTERLKAASWLIKSIHQRQTTIYRVAESITKFQREFLDQGVQKLKPLVLKDVADDIGMHESTVSRVTTNKYMHTPQGVYELKFFFTTGLKSDDGSEVSSSAIKDRIKRIVAEESPGDPVSDQQIVELLTKENIAIARRTVAKYRESLGIQSSSRRKKLF